MLERDLPEQKAERDGAGGEKKGLEEVNIDRKGVSREIFHEPFGIDNDFDSTKSRCDLKR